MTSTRPRDQWATTFTPVPNTNPFDDDLDPIDFEDITVMHDFSEDKPNIVILGYSGQSDVRLAGGNPISARLTYDALPFLVAEADGLLLLGGGDVNPKLYGGKRDKSVYGVDDERDAVEAMALEIARERGIPIMGICRGNQMMNVTAGGTLHIDLQQNPRMGSYHHSSDVRVSAVRGSRVHDAFGDEPRLTTHIHHQAVKDIAPGFVATSFTKDGCVESIESVTSWEVGVQFHPEMADDKHNYNLFAGFVEACAIYADLGEWERPDYVPSRYTYSRFGSGWGNSWSKQSGTSTVTHLVPATDRSRERAPISRSHVTSDDFDTSKMRCGICNIQSFDHYEDFTDHISILHGVPLETVIEIEDKAKAKSAEDSATVFAERNML